MRKAERLFQIIQILRRSTGPVTSSQLAIEVEVARRTIYRDIADLIGQRVPIRGEAGIGYVLDQQYDMPPLMLTSEEIEAVVLGSQMVARLGDRALTTAARDVLTKVALAVPSNLRSFIAEPTVGIRPDMVIGDLRCDTRPLRSALRETRKIRLEYQALNGTITSRVVWPVLLGYDGGICLLIAWCELKEEFRHFRSDRMRAIQVLEDRIDLPKSKLKQKWLQWRQEEQSRRGAIQIP
ncbi:YafY family protein [Rhizobium sp. CNPSo 3968]|uniref:helix-turn-helix transcriptional regulator n=1 Tax=Rhizobium sp. CNPSo 3968 TaxID=3021408 RepID=UPI00254C7CC1|nr:YafY family protein [Rhizobium sp. CNPSo 3968]MDK4717917.1 YafY family protein [Rhizobium sp. CNPSo 3968]